MTGQRVGKGRTRSLLGAAPGGEFEPLKQPEIAIRPDGEPQAVREPGRAESRPMMNGAADLREGAIT